MRLETLMLECHHGWVLMIFLVTVAQRRWRIAGVVTCRSKVRGGEVWLLRRRRGVGMKAFSLWHGEVVRLLLVTLMREVSWVVVVGNSVGRRRIDARMMKRSSSGRKPRHKPQLMHPLLLASLVLEPHLYYPHTQVCVLGQLLPHQPRRLCILVEHILEHLQLLGSDVCPGSSPLAILALLLLISILVIIILFVGLIMVRLLWRLWEWLAGGAGVVDKLFINLGVIQADVEIFFAEYIAIAIVTHLHPLLQHLVTLAAFEAVKVVSVARHAPDVLILGEHCVTGAAGGWAESGVVLDTVEGALVTVACADQQLVAVNAGHTAVMVHCLAYLGHGVLGDDAGALAALHADVVLSYFLMIWSGALMEHDRSVCKPDNYWRRFLWVTSRLVTCYWPLDLCTQVSLHWSLHNGAPMGADPGVGTWTATTKKWCFPWIWSTWRLRQRHRQSSRWDALEKSCFSWCSRWVYVCSCLSRRARACNQFTAIIEFQLEIGEKRRDKQLLRPNQGLTTHTTTMSPPDPKQRFNQVLFCNLCKIVMV